VAFERLEEAFGHRPGRLFVVVSEDPVGDFGVVWLRDGGLDMGAASSAADADEGPRERVALFDAAFDFNLHCQRRSVSDQAAWEGAQEAEQRHRGPSVPGYGCVDK